MNKILCDSTFLCLLLIGFIIQLPITLASTYILAALYLAINNRKIQFNKEHMLYWILVTGICLIPTLTLNHGATPVFYLFSTSFLVFSAKQFSKNKLIHIVDCLRNVYWFFTLCIIVIVLKNWGDPVPLEIFSWSSTNGIPSYLIVVQIAYSLAYYLKNDRLPLLSAAATLAVAFFGLGRGSMVVAALIVLISFIFNTIAAKSNFYRKNTVILIFIVTVWATINFEEVYSAIDFWIEGSKFSTGVLDEHRGYMIADYLNNIDGFSFLFGMDFTGTSISQYYGGNPHNSFIRAHSFYGLAGLVLIFSPLVFIIISKKYVIQKYLAVVLISLALVRSTTETIFFPSTLDFFYILCFFIFFRFSKNKIERY